MTLGEPMPVSSARYYQLEAAAAFAAYPGTKGRMIVMATGTGKTFTGHLIALPYLQAGKRVLWLADRKKLVFQGRDSLLRHFPEHGHRSGVVWRHVNEADKQMVYASKDTIRKPKRLGEVLAHGDFDLVVVDEAHHSAATSWSTLLAHFPRATLLGLTATPARQDNRKLSEKWEIVYAYDILSGLRDKALIPPYAALDLIPGFDAADVPQSGGDYDEGELERQLLKAHVVDHTVEAILGEHEGERLPFRDEQETFSIRDRSCLVFCAGIEQAQLTAEALRKRGIEARAVWGAMPQDELDRLVGLFEEGRITVLCNAILLTEGVDIPCAQVAVFARPTRSWSLFVQMVGRVLRPYESQEHAYVLDLCGCTAEHSIVAAPVLVEGDDCSEAPDGQHSYLPLGTGEGRCMHCGKLIKCHTLGGGHKFGKDKKCVGCGTVQCAGSPDRAHHWIPWEDGKRVCIHCALEIPDPMAALVDRSIPVKEEVAWKRLRAPGEVYAVDLGRIGMMFNINLGNDLWQPLLVVNGEPKPLSPRPVDGKMARLLTDDVARRVGKVNGFRGGKETEAAMRIAMVRAESAARTMIGGGK